MGYYSEIGLCLNKTSNDKMLAALSTQADAEKKEIQDLFNVAEKKVSSIENGECVAYHWPWLKWYSRFTEVKFVEDFISTLDNDSYLFFRIGEEDTDIERYGGFWDNPLGMNLCRTVDFD